MGFYVEAPEETLKKYGAVLSSNDIFSNNRYV